jgi:hypothetical protein
MAGAARQGHADPAEDSATERGPSRGERVDAGPAGFAARRPASARRAEGSATDWYSRFASCTASRRVHRDAAPARGTAAACAGSANGEARGREYVDPGATRCAESAGFAARAAAADEWYVDPAQA